MKLKVYNKEGKVAEEIEVSEKVFAVAKNDDLIHQVYVALMANRREVLAHTKTRGERAGSGIKPWKQKGTGRARVGSVRTPLWKKGGIVFGPRSNRNYSQKVNHKMNTKAIVMVLSGKLADSEIKVIDKIDFAEKKTKGFVNMLKNLEISGRVLMAFSDAEKDIRMLSRNIDKADNIMINQLNVAEMLNHKFLVMSKEAVEYLDKKYAK